MFVTKYLLLKKKTLSTYTHPLKQNKANNWTVTDITNPTATLLLTHFPCFLTRSSITIVHYTEKMFQFRARGILQSPLGKLIRSLQTQTEHCLSHVCPGEQILCDPRLVSFTPGTEEAATQLGAFNCLCKYWGDIRKGCRAHFSFVF